MQVLFYSDNMVLNGLGMYSTAERLLLTKTEMFLAG